MTKVTKTPRRRHPDSAFLQPELFGSEKQEKKRIDPSYYTSVGPDGTPYRWLDPMPESEQDSKLWQALLGEALKTDKKLHGLLHILRILGAQIVDGDVVPPPLGPGPTARDYYLRKAEIQGILGQVLARGQTQGVERG